MAGKQFELQGKHGNDKSIGMAIIILNVALVVFTIICIQVVA